MKKKHLLKEIKSMVDIIWGLHLKNQALSNELERMVGLQDACLKLESEKQILTKDAENNDVIIANLTKKVSALREENNALIKSNQVLLEKNMKLVGRQYIDPPKKRR